MPPRARPALQRSATQGAMKTLVSRTLHSTADGSDVWQLVQQVGEQSRVGAPRNALSRGRAIESVDWLEEMFRYLCVSSAIGIDHRPCVRVPLTMLFRYTRPHVWYESREGGGVRESPVTEAVCEIIERFVEASRAECAASDAKHCDILCTYMYTATTPPEAAGGAPGTHTVCEYLSHELLIELLRHRSRKHDGVLQLFVAPTGGRASTVRAKWRAGAVTAESRTNMLPISDTRRPLVERAVTFDGHEHQMRTRALDRSCALHAAASEHLAALAAHLIILIPRQYAVTEIVAYMRVHPDGLLYLLCVPSIGLSDAASGAPVACAIPSSPRVQMPQLSYIGTLPRDVFRCPTCGAAVALRHRTEVPFKSVLLHVCVLDEEDGVIDGDSESIRRIASVLERMANNPDYWADMYAAADRARPHDSALALLRNDGYPGGDHELNDKLETEAERVCFRLLQTAERSLTPAHYRWLRDHKPALLYRIGIFVCTDCSLDFSHTAMAEQSRANHALGATVRVPAEWAAGARAERRRRGAGRRRRRGQEPTPDAAGGATSEPDALSRENAMRKARSLPLLRARVDRAAQARSRP